MLERNLELIFHTFFLQATLLHSTIDAYILQNFYQTNANDFDDIIDFRFSYFHHLCVELGIFKKLKEKLYLFITVTSAHINLITQVTNSTDRYLLCRFVICGYRLVGILTLITAG